LLIKTEMMRRSSGPEKVACAQTNGSTKFTAPLRSPNPGLMTARDRQARHVSWSVAQLALNLQGEAVTTAKHWQNSFALSTKPTHHRFRTSFSLMPAY
jgi:hypothetical protein